MIPVKYSHAGAIDRCAYNVLAGWLDRMVLIKALQKTSKFHSGFKNKLTLIVCTRTSLLSNIESGPGFLSPLQNSLKSEGVLAAQRDKLLITTDLSTFSFVNIVIL